MSEEQTTALSLRAAYMFGAANGLEKEVNDIKNMTIEWDAPYTSTVRRGYVADLFEKRNIFDAFKKTHWAYGNTPAGETKRRWYSRIKKRYEEFLTGGDHGNDLKDAENEQEFAAEADLRDFLAACRRRAEAWQRSEQDNRPVAVLHGMGRQESSKRALSRHHHRKRDPRRPRACCVARSRCLPISLQSERGGGTGGVGTSRWIEIRGCLNDWRIVGVRDRGDSA
jgi:hypothetical protein